MSDPKVTALITATKAARKLVERGRAPDPLQVADRRHNDTHIRPCSPDCATCHPWQVVGRLAEILKKIGPYLSHSTACRSASDRRCVCAIELWQERRQAALAEYQAIRKGK